MEPARSESVRLFQSVEHGCGYYADRSARNLVLDPVAPELPLVYGRALEHGFRRAGGHVYRPNCHGCRACVACRLRVADFQPDRSQRRLLRANADLRWSMQPAHYSEEHYALYGEYLRSRHPGGGMDDAGPEDFVRFLQCGWAETCFLEARLDDRLVACAVTDLTRVGASAVYTFYDPGLRPRALGICAILEQIRRCREMGLPYLYLGYWIDGHPKMHYKRGFRALELLVAGRWETQGGSGLGA